MIYQVCPQIIEDFCDVQGGRVWNCGDISPERILARVAQGDTISTPWLRIPRHPTAYSSNIRPAVPRSSDRSAVAV